MSKNPFAGLTAVKSSADVLTANKEHAVRLMWHKSTDSFTNHKDQDAGKSHEWADPTPQILCQFGNEKGVFMHRFNLRGYKSFDELTDKQIEKHGLVNVQGYACKVDEDGDKLRIEDKEKTEACINIIQDFLYKLGGADATGDDVDKFIAEKKLVVMKLVKDESEAGNGRTIVKYFREYTADDAEEELEKELEVQEELD